MGILTVCRPETLAEKFLLDEPGAFAWWYCDLVSPEGDGAVVIGFFGLPFLPDYQRSRGVPREHPGLNVALYRSGKPEFYLLQEYQSASVEFGRERATMCLGDSVLTLSWEGSHVRLEGDLDLVVPGSRERTRGKLDVRGFASRVDAMAGDPRHVWCPIAPSAVGRLELHDGRRALAPIVGRAYVDANASAVSLPDLDLESWRWGRIAFPEREVVFYEMTGTNGATEPLVLSFPRSPAAATSKSSSIVRSCPRRGFYGLDWHERSELVDPSGSRISVHARHLVEDGPFYLRWLIEARCAETGEVGHGVSELVDVAKIDASWQRPFVRMRRHVCHGENSMWVPLFSGPRSGRATRLLRHWLGRPKEASAP